jgi:hypothetical protein
MKLIFPEAILNQHIAVLGKTGAGKSSALRHIVEHLLRHKKRVCVVDPKGDWWGLKSSAAGDGPGFPVIAFGDFKEPKAQDVPINAQSGKHVAELITAGNRPCIIGFRGWMTSHMVKFWIDFASTLFNANSGELYLVGDEFHNFAPKGKIMDPEAGKCLHWSNRLMSEGRGYGLVCLIASQRPQKVHNDTLTCCETLVAMRVIHAADRGAVKDWIDGCGDMAQGREVLDNLAGMARGEAYVWSPEIAFGPKRLTFPMFETFDSFAPPQLQRKTTMAGWADVNLDEVKEKMATVIEEAKANDPAELKKKIRELEQKAKAKPDLGNYARSSEEFSATKSEIKKLTKELEIAMKFIVEISTRNFESTVPKEEIQQALKLAMERVTKVIDENLQNRQKTLSKLKTDAEKILSQIKSIAGEKVSVNLDVRHNEPFTVESGTNRRQSEPITASNGDLDVGQQQILDTILMLNVRGIVPSRNNIARWHKKSNRDGIHPTGGTYGQNLAFLRANGYLNGCELTEKGAAAARPIETGLDAAKQTVDPSQERILEQLQDGQSHDRNSLAAALDLHPTGGTFGQNLARLRCMGLIPERGTIKLTPAATA